MNKGIQRATGDWIQFLNAGDVYASEQSLEQVFLSLPKTAAFVYADTLLITERGTLVRYLPAPKLTRKTVTKGMIVCHQAMFIKRTRCPDYAVTYRYKADFNWVLDVINQLEPQEITYVPEAVVQYRLGGFSQSQYKKQDRKSTRLNSSHSQQSRMPSSA